MRHARTGKKLGRDSAHRKALYSNLAGALIEHGRIRTTVTKAKAVKPIAEQMITLGRRGDLHARRQATSFLRSRDVVHKLFAEVAPLFKDRPGGYTRIIKIGPRAGRLGRDGLPRARRRGVRREGARRPGRRSRLRPRPKTRSEPEVEPVSDTEEVSDTRCQTPATRQTPAPTRAPTRAMTAPATLTSPSDFTKLVPKNR